MTTKTIELSFPALHESAPDATHCAGCNRDMIADCMPGGCARSGRCGPCLATAEEKRASDIIAAMQQLAYALGDLDTERLGFETDESAAAALALVHAALDNLTGNAFPWDLIRRATDAAQQAREIESP